MILKLLVVLLPWRLKRMVLQRWLRFDLHPSARIGLSWVFPAHLTMGPESSIDHLCVAVHLDRMQLGEESTIGRGNWITGFSSGSDSAHFAHQPERRSVLVLGDHSAITKDHHLDCTSAVTIGAFSTVAGYRTQILTHSIDLTQNRQDSKPISIGDYCFVGTSSVLLGGSALPDRSVLGAKSVLTKAFAESLTLYAGNPARPIKKIGPDAKYFTRERGFVV